MYTKKQVQAIFQISRPTLETLMKNGEVKYFNVGRSIRFHEDYIKNYGRESK